VLTNNSCFNEQYCSYVNKIYEGCEIYLTLKTQRYWLTILKSFGIVDIIINELKEVKMAEIKIRKDGVLGSVAKRQKAQNETAKALGLPKPYKENIGKKVRNYIGKEAKKRAPSSYKKLLKTLNPNW